MPQIKVERIVSFTSEDSTHTASNILSKDTSKKWKCKTPGEKSASIVLQLDQPYVINGIDIGNENSAYIEVLVSRSSTPEDFKVLLVMSSFMTPLEARQSQNINKVRMFKYDDLSEPERNEKWDRVKIVCTQPFNRHVQYGLSFINLYSSESKNSENPQQTSIGKFIIRPESPDGISAGSLFARRKQMQDGSREPLLKGAAAIREATSLAHVGSPAPKQKIKLNLPTTPNVAQINKNVSDDESSTPKERKERNRNELLYSKDEEDKHDKIDRLIEKRDVEKAEFNRKQKDKPKDTPSKKRDKEEKTTPKLTDAKPKKTDASKDNKTPKESLKRKLKAEPVQKVKKTKKELMAKPFERLMEDVVLVISGIQNPDRASLRSMALSMGAKYKPDWDSTCTHLVCAFANTPKFNQVKGKGKIVKRSWVEDCYNERKKLPWRRYALDKADQGPESEEEICEKEDTPSFDNVEAKMYNINSDDDDDTREQGSDTDEKIAKIMENRDDIYGFDTDTESNDDKIHANTEIKRKLENLFDDKIFYVDENFDADMEKKIKQYIVAYNGILVENLESSIDIIVTNRENYKVLKDIYPSATCIAPDWIWECHNCKKLVPMNDFVYG